MGTVFTFKVRTELSVEESAQAMVRATEQLHGADETFSLYKPESPLSRLARGETSVDELDPVVEFVWDECEKWEVETGGWFKAFTPQHTFDPSGFVKTWAATLAAEQLRAAGIVDFTINAGGDVVINDGVTDHIDWCVGIGKPVSIASSDAGVLTVFDLQGTEFRAVATSGSVERGDHIWNPMNPEDHQRDLLQVSVIATDLVKADVWATAAFAEGVRSVERLNREPGIEALYVMRDGSLAATDGIMRLFAKTD
jgi:thiamine biosynthesis lipoprotein